MVVVVVVLVAAIAEKMQYRMLHLYFSSDLSDGLQESTQGQGAQWLNLFDLSVENNRDMFPGSVHLGFLHPSKSIWFLMISGCRRALGGQ